MTMIKIRKGVFETNSSSMHSVCITSNEKRYSFAASPQPLCIRFGNYGWGYEELHSVEDKLSYVLTSIRYFDSSVENIETLSESMYFKWICEMVEDYTGFTIGKEKPTSFNFLDSDSDDLEDPNDTNMGYVDHQSTDILSEYWSDDEDTFKENIKELIFNDHYSIIIDNDNH